jgi:hypothetical protein
MNAPAVFQVGDRVRLSALGRSRFLKTPDRSGVVIRISKSKMGGRSVAVLFDGNATPTRVHRSYIEPD